MSLPRATAPSAIQPHPRKEFRARIQLVQHRRGPDNPTWEARFKISGTWTSWTSLKTDDHMEAAFESVAKFAEREQMAVQGIAPPSRKKKELHTVAEIAVTTLARLDQERRTILATEPEKKASKLVTKINRIRHVIVPALGERGIASLTEEDMENFANSHRVAGDKEAKAGTIGGINSSWLEIVQDAIALGYLPKAQTRRLIISAKHHAKGLRGDAFTSQEMQRIRHYMSDEWINAGHHNKVRETRFLLRALVSLMAATGITPGLEVETLTPAQVTETIDSHGYLGLRVAIKGEQGKRKPSRVVWARVDDGDVIAEMRRLQQWITANATDQYRDHNPKGYLFARPSDGEFPNFAEVFATVLDNLGIRQDPVTGVQRRLYSCRHYYATQSLLHGATTYDVSKNMGNSERMIRDHYDHVIADLRSGHLTGSGRARDRDQRLSDYADQELRRHGTDPAEFVIADDPDDHL